MISLQIPFSICFLLVETFVYHFIFCNSLCDEVANTQQQMMMMMMNDVRTTDEGIVACILDRSQEARKIAEGG
jgi:hypothetical protein